MSGPGPRPPKKSRPPQPERPAEPKRPSGPLTELQSRVLLAALVLERGGNRYPTPNELGVAVGTERFKARRHGTGNTTRTFGLAQQIIPSLTGLTRRGLLRQTGRDDGYSGTAYTLTADGRAAALELERAGSA